MRQSLNKYAWAALLACTYGCSSGSESGPAAPPADQDASVDQTSDAPESDGGADATQEGATDGGIEDCNSPPIVPTGDNFFVDISEASGIRADNFVPNPPTAIPINDHSRLGFADINGDGYDDIVAHSLFPNPKAGIPFEHLVFINNKDGTFKNASDESGLRAVQAGFFAFGDVDNDGDQDAFAGLDITDLAGQTHHLYKNDGSGHFAVVTASGLEGTAGQTTASNGVFADFDGDADLDLFVANGQTGYLSLDQLFYNDGTGTFTKAPSSALGGNYAAASNGAVACDYDNDGDLDIFVSVYGVSSGGAQDFLYENDGHGSFVDVAVERGFASMPTGNPWLDLTDHGKAVEPNKEPGTYTGGNGFGIDCGDINNDGLLDIFITNISHPVASDLSRAWSDPTLVLINQGAAQGWAFRNETADRKVPFNEGDVDGAAIDFDNDGRLDLSISRDKKYEGSYTAEDQKAWFGLLHQLADGSFESLGVKSGINDPGLALLRMKNAQNHAWSDIDRDGDLDLLVGGRDTGGGRPNFLFKNQIGSQNRWLALHMVGDGVKVNRDAIGARVTVRDNVSTYLREVRATRGMYNSMDGRALLFGLGTLGCSYTIEARWPDGTTVALSPDAVGMNRYVTITYPDKIVVD
ncbi:MAG: CRTAC1 family protein [Deltaproteobacteria bacterium]|nr:CRTAC1 family protein [Deltaproteobacteria bacterium]